MSVKPAPARLHRNLIDSLWTTRPGETVQGHPEGGPVVQGTPADERSGAVSSSKCIL